MNRKHRGLHFLSFSIALLGFLTSCFLCGGTVRAAEYTYSFTYSGTSTSNTVYWDDSLTVGQIKGVIVTFNYGATVYNNVAWRNFAKDRGLALLLMINLDILGIPANTTDGMSLINSTLSSVATQSGHSELAASTIPFDGGQSSIAAWRHASEWSQSGRSLDCQQGFHVD